MLIELKAGEVVCVIQGAHQTRPCPNFHLHVLPFRPVKALEAEPQAHAHLHFHGGRLDRNSAPGMASSAGGAAAPPPAGPPPFASKKPFAACPPGLVAPLAYLSCSVTHVLCACVGYRAKALGYMIWSVPCKGLVAPLAFLSCSVTHVVCACLGYRAKVLKHMVHSICPTRFR